MDEYDDKEGESTTTLWRQPRARFDDGVRQQQGYFDIGDCGQMR